MLEILFAMEGLKFMYLYTHLFVIFFLSVFLMNVKTKLKYVVFVLISMIFLYT